MAEFKCEKCGASKEGRCKPKKCAVCGESGCIIKVEVEGKKAPATGRGCKKKE